MQEKLIKLAEFWIGYKQWLVQNVGLTNDAMHVHFSLLILMGSAVLLRRRPDSPLCWLVVLAFELFNEYADIRGSAPGEATIDASLHDIYNTMFWPTLLLLLGWFLFPRRLKVPPEAKPSGDLADQPLEQPPSV